MKNIQRGRYDETLVLVQNLNHQLISLATSLKGRLSPSEETTLANLFQIQIDLQTLLDEALSDSREDGDSPAQAESGQETDGIAYAQAMQYARDLVKALRQDKEHRRRLELTSQQLIRAEKLATVGQVAATVAHELGNIFTPLLMYAKLVYEETVDIQDSDAAEFALQITQIAGRASHMLRQLVDASRIESTMMMPVELPCIIQNTLNLLTPQINKQNINVKQDYHENVPAVIGQADQIEQVFINIARNAFDAMPEGGDFRIKLERGNGADGAANKTNFVAVSFSDTGEGIPAENIGALFEPFFTTKSRGAGSGLGLFVSYLIINQHGGTIEVESEPGTGTTFIVKLPLGDKSDGVG